MWPLHMKTSQSRRTCLQLSAAARPQASCLCYLQDCSVSYFHARTACEALQSQFVAQRCKQRHTQSNTHEPLQLPAFVGTRARTRPAVKAPYRFSFLRNQNCWIFAAFSFCAAKQRHAHAWPADKVASTGMWFHAPS